MFKYILASLLMGLALLPPEAGAWVRYHSAGVVRGPAGGTAAWHRGGWGGGWGYHGATVVTHPVYHTGCWGCGAAAAGAVGLAAGAAIGAAAASSSPTVVVQQPVYVSAPAVGATVVTLPGDCKSATVNGVRYYGCGSTYYQPHFGNNGVYYTVVANPF